MEEYIKYLKLNIEQIENEELNNNTSEFRQGKKYAYYDALNAVKKLIIDGVINWVACKDVKPVDGKEYLISDGEDVTEAQWYDDSKWGGEPYDSYTHYAEKPKTPCL